MSKGFDTCIKELESRGLVPAKTYAVFLVGSVARGWGNALSDYDIYLVGPEPWHSPSSTVLRLPLETQTVPVEVIHADGRRWEMKYWLDSQVDQMLAKVSWEEFDKGHASGALLTDVEELFLERLPTCVPLSGEDWIERRRGQLEQSAFRSLMVTRSLTAADGAVEDALGQLEADDLESAVLSARKAFGHSVDALLESCGQYGHHTPKWRARRFRAAEQSVLGFDAYWRLETMGDFDPEHPGRWVRQVIELCKNLAMDVEI